MARNDSANEIAVLIMFDQDLLCLFKFRGSRSTLAYRRDSIHHAFGFYPKVLTIAVQVGRIAKARYSIRF